MAAYQEARQESWSENFEQKDRRVRAASGPRGRARRYVRGEKGGAWTERRKRGTKERRRNRKIFTAVPSRGTVVVITSWEISRSPVDFRKGQHRQMWQLLLYISRIRVPRAAADPTFYLIIPPGPFHLLHYLTTI